MDISVVVTVYNKAKEVARALRSVGNQTVYPKEIIVVDDGSSDGSAEIVKRTKMPGLRLVSQGNTSVYGARNRGIVEAQCELVAFLDGDDTWEPRFLEVVSKMRNKYPNCGLYGSAWQKRTPSGDTFAPRFHGVPSAGEYGILENYFVSVSKGEVFSSSSVAAPKEVLESVGMFSLWAGRGGDREMWLRIAVDYPLAFCNEVLATWYLDASSRVSNTSDYHTDHPVITTGEVFLSREDLPKEIRHGLSMHVTSTRIFLARQLILAGKPEESRRVLLGSGIPSSYVMRWLACLLGGYLPKNMFCRLYDLYGLIRHRLGLLLYNSTNL